LLLFTHHSCKENWCRMDSGNSAAHVQCLHCEHAEGPWWISGPELLVLCGCHTLLKFSNLIRCWCSLITPANKPSLTDTGWTLGIIQHMFNVYIVNMLKAPWWTSRWELFYCGCHTVLKFIKLTRCWCSLTSPVNKPFLTDTGWTLEICQSEHAEGPQTNHSRLELLEHCGCHTVSKFIKLMRCFYSLIITPADKPSLTATGWTLEIIQLVFNVCMY